MQISHVGCHGVDTAGKDNSGKVGLTQYSSICAKLTSSDNRQLWFIVKSAQCLLWLGFPKTFKKAIFEMHYQCNSASIQQMWKNSIIIPKRISFLPISEMSRLLCSYKRKTMMAAIGNKTHYILRQYVFFTLRDREHWWYKSWTRCGTGSRLNCKTKAVQAIYWAILTSNNSCP